MWKKLWWAVLAVQLGWSSAVYAENVDKGRSRLVAIANRANSNFALFGAELALQKGEPATALATYLSVLKKTRDAEVAERAMEVAIGLHALPQAETVYRLWTEIEPVPSAAQKRLAWMRDMLKGTADLSGVDFEALLQGANDAQVRRIFLLTAQTAVRRPELAAQLGRQVHRAAEQRRNVPEALIADAIFSAMNHRERDVVDALQRLAKLDGKILPPTMLTIRLIAKNNPEAVSRFFAETDTTNLSEQWQELQINTLIQLGKKDQAAELVKQLLATKPHALLYMQAAYLAMDQNRSDEEILAYLTQAMQSGNKDDQSHAALMAAMYLADVRHDYAQARVWLDKIGKAPFKYEFDAAVLSALLAAQNQNWQQALGEVARAQKLTDQSNGFYSSEDLTRIRIYAVAHGETPQRAVAALSKMYREAQKGGDETLALEILRQRGLVYVNRLNRADLAVADFKRYLNTDPNNTDVLNELGYTMLYLPKADVGEAFRYIELAYQQDPQSPYINDSMGWAYFRKGDAQSALPYLEFAFKETPHPEVAAHLGEVLWTTGDKARAQEVFKAGLQQQGDDRAELLRTLKRLGIRLPEMRRQK